MSSIQSEPATGATSPSLQALVAFIPSIIVITISLWIWRNDIEADKTARSTRAVITRNDGRNYSYTYKVDDASYNGEEINKLIPVLAVGDQLPIIYRPEHPEISTMAPRFGDTDSRPVPLILAVLLGLYLYFRLRRFLLQRSKIDPYEDR